METFRGASVASILAAFFFFSIQSSQAGSATWHSSPVSGDWNTATNWTPATVPNGPADTALFGVSSINGVSISANTEVNSLLFNPGASPFTITAPPLLTLTISGGGITNNSGTTQNFVTNVDAFGNHGTVNFVDNATAGVLTSFTNDGQLLSGTEDGGVQFFGTSSAGNANFINNPASAPGLYGGRTRFFESASAGQGTFNNIGGTIAGAPGGATVFFNSSSAANGNFISSGATATNALTGQVSFFDSSTAGEGIFTNSGSSLSGRVGGEVFFHGNSSAANATFMNQGSAVAGALGGAILFFDNSSAGGAIVTNDGGLVSAALHGQTQFFQHSSAGSGVFIAHGGVNGGFGGGTIFFNDSDAENATLIADGDVAFATSGFIVFFQDAKGRRAHVKLYDYGILYVRFRNPPGITIGSIEGNGIVILGRNNLTVGAGDYSSVFSGAIRNGGLYSRGTLTKIGTGTLTLAGTNRYTGDTTVDNGTLLITNMNRSAIQVNRGTLGGTGTTAGAISVGTGTGVSAFLSPGETGPGTLESRKTLTLNFDATYNCEVDSRSGTADSVVAKGVTINNGAVFAFTDLGNVALTTGTVFTVINNTNTKPISGTFSNLADGSTFTAGGNTYQASYSGGDGNDLTLTVQ